MKKKLPSNPSQRPTFAIEVTARLDSDPNVYNNGFMHMKFQDTTVDVSDDKDNVLGSISGCIGGGIEVHIKGQNGQDSRDWFVPFDLIWEKVVKVDAEYMASLEQGRKAAS